MTDSSQRQKPGPGKPLTAQHLVYLRLMNQGLKQFRGLSASQVLLPAALQPRRADSTEVIGTALARKAEGLGYRRIATRTAVYTASPHPGLRERTDAIL